MTWNQLIKAIIENIPQDKRNEPAHYAITAESDVDPIESIGLVDAVAFHQDEWIDIKIYSMIGTSS